MASAPQLAKERAAILRVIAALVCLPRAVNPVCPVFVGIDVAVGEVLQLDIDPRALAKASQLVANAPKIDLCRIGAYRPRKSRINDGALWQSGLILRKPQR